MEFVRELSVQEFKSSWVWRTSSKESESEIALMLDSTALNFSQKGENDSELPVLMVSSELSIIKLTKLFVR
jgi:hypothetical protein